MASIIGHHLRDDREMFPVVVVSAMSGVTDQLLRIARFACIGDLEAVQQELNVLRQKHVEAADEAVRRHDGRQALQRDLQSAFSMLKRDIRAVEAGRSTATRQHSGDSHASALYAAPAISLVRHEMLETHKKWREACQD